MTTITVTVDDVQLPEAVQRGASTIIDDPLDPSNAYSGIDQRVRKNSRRPRQFTIGYNVKAQTDRQAIIDLYHTNGQLVGFLFRDPLEHTLVNQQIDIVSGSSISNGTNRNFPALRTHSTTARSYVRRITRLVNDGTITVTVGGTPETHFTIGALGVIVFDVGHAPASNAAVVITFAKYLTPVRFASKLSTRIDTYLKVSVPTATLEEVFEV